MTYIYEQHLHQVALAMRATGDNRGELLTEIIRRGIIERWPESWLIAALAQHISEEQAEELAHQEAVYYTQSLLIGEQIAVAERLGLCVFKEWRARSTACTECQKMDCVRVSINANFPAHGVRLSGIWVDLFFSYAHQNCECRLVFCFK